MTAFVEVPAAGGGPGGGNYQTVQAVGVDLPQQPTMNFTSNLLATNDGGGSRTNVAVAYGATAGVAVEGNDFRVTRPRIVVQQQLAAGSPGGAGSAGWNTRALNTLVVNTIAGVTLSSNDLVDVPAGTYLVWAWAPAFKCDAHRLRLRNITDGATLVLGSIAYSYSAQDPQVHAVLMGQFTIAAAKTIRLQHFIQNPPTAPNDIYCFGSESGPADTEVGVFAQMILERVA